MPSILLMERAGLATAEAIVARGFPRPARRPGRGRLGQQRRRRHGRRPPPAERGLGRRGRGARADPPRPPDAGTMTAIAATAGHRGRAVPPGPGRRAARRRGRPARHGRDAAPRATPPPRRSSGWPAAAPRSWPWTCPRGVEADTGRAAGPAVRADLTVTYHGDMVGLQGRARLAARRAGRRRRHRHPGGRRPCPRPPGSWARARWRRSRRRPPPRDKYARRGGARGGGVPGADRRARRWRRGRRCAPGAGLVVVATPAAVQPAVAAHLLEVMCAPLPDEGRPPDAGVGRGGRRAGPPGRRARPRAGARPGRRPPRRRSPASCAGVDLPAGVDADGLWHLGDAARAAAGRARRRTVLTPHAGEAARLLGRARAEVEAARLDAARELADALAGDRRAEGRRHDRGRARRARRGRTRAARPASRPRGPATCSPAPSPRRLAKGVEPFARPPRPPSRPRPRRRAGRRGDGTIASDVLEALPEASGLPPA